MTYSGQCQCGAVTATITGKHVAVRQCWCRQCQQVAAGSPTVNAIFPAEGVAIQGELSSNAYVADSGNTLTQYYCAACGTPVVARSSARPQFRTVRLGFLDLPHDLKPEMAIWLDDAPDWAVIDPALEHFARQPPAPTAR